MAQRERTFIMIKPDGVQRGLVGKIISRFEEKGFKLVAMKFMQASQELLEQHYSELAGRPFFAGLVNYMQLGPVVPMVWEGLNIVKTARDIIGATNPMDSLPGTLRGDLCVQVGSDSNQHLIPVNVERNPDQLEPTRFENYSLADAADKKR
ncbi:Nucleoside diphosphate kinase [Araneus ventricosus]|uniref:nucleoside-diphosphate kinase n=1 Tax=Araneus ventricosus TaxID=182803 RepID=A0A4Y2BTJ7_ARAVE|nr:Nucleoside diphosphate kinase [Araneus ventricosus]